MPRPTAPHALLVALSLIPCHHGAQVRPLGLFHRGRGALGDRSAASQAHAAAFGWRYRADNQQHLLQGTSCSREPTDSPPYYSHCAMERAAYPSVNWYEMFNATTYPLSVADFKRITSTARYGKLQPLLRNLAQGRRISVLVLGGSMTCGINCGQGKLIFKECAWPARFAKWLQEKFPRASVEMHNAARPGTPLRPQLAMMGVLMQELKHVDLILVDTLINDRVSTKNEVSNYLEQLVRSVHEASPRTIVMSVLGHSFQDTWEAKRGHLQVMDHYGLPRFDFASLVEKNRVDMLWPGGEHHPHWTAHQLIADGLANIFGTALADPHVGEPLDRALPAPIWAANGDPQHWETCMKPLTVYTATAPKLQPVRLKGKWTLFEDRPGKPGWIAEGYGSQIRFRVKFSGAPKLMVSYLRSYENLAMANMTLGSGVDRHALPNLDGIRAYGGWQYREDSQTDTLFASLGHLQGFNSTVVDVDFELVHRVPLRFDIRTDGKKTAPKFKIVDVLSC